MGGPSGLKLSLPIAPTSPVGFAEGVVSGAYGVRGMVLYEAVFEDAGLKTLARLLEAVREGRYVQARDLARAERVIARLAARDWPTIKRALAFAQLQDSRFRVDPFAKFDPKGLGDILLPKPVEQATFATVDGSVASRRRPRPYFAKEDPTSAIGRSNRIVSPMPKPDRGSPAASRGVAIDDLYFIEELEEGIIGEDWWWVVIDGLKGVLGMEEGRPLSLGLRALEDPNHSVAVKAVALRMIFQQTNHLRSVDELLRTLEPIVGIILDPQADQRLKDMAVAFLIRQRQSFDLPGILAKAVDLIRADDEASVDLQLFSGRQWVRVRRADLLPYQDRVFELTQKLGQIFSGLQSIGTSQGEVIPITWMEFLPNLLGIVASDPEVQLRSARIIFGDENQPTWKREIAMTYYSYLIFGEKRLALSEEEAEAAISALFRLASWDALGKRGTIHRESRVAHHVFERVIEGRRKTVRQLYPTGHQAILAVDRWALNKVKHWGGHGGLIRAIELSIKAQAPSWRQRLFRWLSTH